MRAAVIRQLQGLPAAEPFPFANTFAAIEEVIRIVLRTGRAVHGAALLKAVAISESCRSHWTPAGDELSRLGLCHVA